MFFSHLTVSSCAALAYVKLVDQGKHMNHTYRVVDGAIIPGVYLQAFIKNGKNFFATEIKVFKDGKIFCWDWVNLDTFKKKVEEGWVRTRLPEGARVSLMVSGCNLVATKVDMRVEEQEFVKEVEDALRKLNDLSTTSESCGNVYEKYKAEPSEANKQFFREAFEAVPKHRRQFLHVYGLYTGEIYPILGELALTALGITEEQYLAMREKTGD